MKRISKGAIRSGFVNRLVKFLEDNRKTVLSFVIAAIFADILFIKSASDFMFFGILISYLVFIRIFDLKSRTTFLISLTLLVAMLIGFLFTGASALTEKAAVWFVLFLITGVIHQWKE